MFECKPLWGSYIIRKGGISNIINKETNEQIKGHFLPIPPSTIIPAEAATLQKFTHNWARMKSGKSFLHSLELGRVLLSILPKSSLALF